MTLTSTSTFCSRLQFKMGRGARWDKKVEGGADHGVFTAKAMAAEAWRQFLDSYGHMMNTVFALFVALLAVASLQVHRKQRSLLNH